jgi:hypothetical protein
VATLDPLYVEARRVLLDALQALADHRDAVIVSGAQAVYLRTGDAGLSIAPYTTDGDVALDPGVLAKTPEIAQAMTGAGFVPLDKQDPGVWIASGHIKGRTVTIPVDLMVPKSVASPVGDRGARLEGHGKRAARKVPGIEAVLIDNAWMLIEALSAEDSRSVQARVAGPTALLIAKAHKIDDRLQEGKEHRQDDKDALDVYRLMQTTRIEAVGATMPKLLADPRSEQVAAEGLAIIVKLFGARRAPGVAMAVRSLQGTIPDARVETVCAAFVSQIKELC